MIKEKLLLIGGGGHCKSVIEAIDSRGLYQIAGIIDSPEKIGEFILGYPIIGTDAELEVWVKKIPNVIITVGQLVDAQKRMGLYSYIKSLGGILPFIVASTAYVSVHARLGEGTVVLHNAVVNVEATIGVNTIINTSAIIEHNSTVGSHTHISTGAVVNGGCIIGDQVLVGSNAVLKQGVKVEDRAVIGAGSVVLKDVKNGSLIIGNPGKEKEKYA